MLNKIILVCFILLAFLVVLMLLQNRGGEQPFSMGGGGNILSARIDGLQSGNSSLSGSKIAAFSQRDRGQYSSDDDYKTWSASACSATAIASIFSSQGKAVQTGDILGIMRDRNAISAQSGLFDYSVFAAIGDRYNYRTDYSESRDLDSHFNSILNYLKQGTPVLINVRDSRFFPNGHFIAAFSLNPDNTVTITNSDPEPGLKVLQTWPVDALKTYFSRTNRSVAFLPR